MDVTNQITSVKLSNSLTYIDNYAFASNDIASVTFYGRSNLDDVTLGIDAFGYFDESNITFENY